MDFSLNFGIMADLDLLDYFKYSRQFSFIKLLGILSIDSIFHNEHAHLVLSIKLKCYKNIANPPLQTNYLTN